MNEIASIVQYFRACYRADQREQTIWNILDADKIEHLTFSAGEEQLLTAEIPFKFVETEIATEVQKTLELYRKEKQLYYFAFFIVGKTPAESTLPKEIVAPILYYPAEIIEKDNDNYIQIDFEKQLVNYPLIAALDNIADESYEKDLFEALPNTEINYSSYQRLVEVLERFLTDVDFSEHYHYPDSLFGNTHINETINKNLTFVPATCFGVMASSKNTRGVLNELEIMVQSNDFSNALKAVLGFEEGIPTKKPSKNNWYSNTLSYNQQKIVESALSQTVSVVIGPPGTGKSFTIANLALEAMLKGENILICSRNGVAVDVIADKILSELKVRNSFVRAGKGYKRELANFLSNLQQGIGVLPYADYKVLKKHVRNLQKKNKKLGKEIHQLRRDFSQQLQAEQWLSEFALATNKSSFWQQIKAYFKKRVLKSKSSLAEKLEQINTLIQNEHEQTIDLINWQNKVILTEMHHLESLTVKTFLKALRARRDRKQEELFAQVDLSKIFEALPIWLVTLTDMYEVLPLQKELFDLVIIDEASQCDIASVLPVLQRAKRAVVVGDTKQLRHISFLSKAKLKKLQIDFGLNHTDIDESKLNYRDTSILDLALENLHTKTYFLNEHYRSLPDIIQFSNEMFYDNHLHLMTQTIHNEDEWGLELVKCDGKRNKRGINEVEASLILEKIKKLILQEEKLDTKNCQTIGVLSPFRNQVDYISKKVAKEIDLNHIVKHRIEVGTAHSFQGSEREVMFISWVVDADTPAGAFTHINKSDVFNVSVTRAKHKQYIITSLEPQQIKTHHLFRQYLSYVSKPKAELSKVEKESSSHFFVKEVIKTLSAKGWQCEQNHFVASLKIDILVKMGSIYLGLDLIGLPNKQATTFSEEQYQMLRRAGFMVIPLSYANWHYQQEKAIEEIEKCLKEKKVV